MFATGGNPEAARLSGVETDRLAWGSLIASTGIACFAGLIYSWKFGTYTSSVGPPLLFTAVGAVFFGASQLKGRPNVRCTVIAVASRQAIVKVTVGSRRAPTTRRRGPSSTRCNRHR